MPPPRPRPRTGRALDSMLVLISRFHFAQPARRPARRAALAALTTLAAAVAACRELPFQPQDPATVTFAPSLGITLSQFTRLESGVFIQDAAVGSGALVTDSSVVTVSYRGYRTDGSAFDSTATGVTTRWALRPQEATPVTPLPIAGWVNGLKGARAGGRRRLIIPPSQAYGNTSRPGIPAGSVLYFIVDIAAVTTPVTPPPTTTSARLADAPAPLR